LEDNQPDAIRAFREENAKRIREYPQDGEWNVLSRQWREAAFRRQYMYHFSWLGRPIIQMPADMVAVQEVIYAVNPDVIIETGIAHGGSLILSASILSQLELFEAIASGSVLDPAKPKRRVIGVDIDIRLHNRSAIESHPLSRWITMFEGSSVSPDIVAVVAAACRGARKVMVMLDSNHTHDHVLAELEAYAPMTTSGSYCIVFDTVVEDMPANVFPNRNWHPGNSPKSAIADYIGILRSTGRSAADGRPLQLEIDNTISDKLMVSAAPGGFLKRI
jgi:cephalosporin hydroxylase